MAWVAELKYDQEPLDRNKRVWKAVHPGSNWAGVFKRFEFPASQQANVEAEIEKIKALSEFPQGAALAYYEIRSTSPQQSYINLLFNYYSGGSLEDRVLLPKKPMQSRILIEILRQLTTALAYLGDRRLAHGHLKPKRILLTEENVDKIEVKVSMLGAANIAEWTGGLARDVNSAKYYAPERSTQTGPSGDVWALGVIAYELFEFRNPFLLAGEVEISLETLIQRQQALSGKPLDLSLCHQTPQLVQDFISACLTFSPEQRPDANALLRLPLFRPTVPPPALSSEISAALRDKALVQGKCLGMGTYGRVWEVKQEGSGWVGALKELKYDTSIQRYIDREIATMQDLSQHPNMIEYYCHEYKHQSDAMNETRILLEFCAGGSLHQAIIKPQKELPPSLLVKFLYQLTRAIAYVHSKSIIHRDIKSENILLTSENVEEAELKVCDFGMSRHTEDIKLAESQGRWVNLTPNLGTAKYMAPELLLDDYTSERLNIQNYDQRVDVWALGLVAFDLFTFQNPFILQGKKSDIPDIKARQQKLQSEPINWSPYPRVPEAVRDFISLCLTYDRRQRPEAQDLLSHPLFSARLESPILPPVSPSLSPACAPPSQPRSPSLMTLQRNSVELAQSTLQHINNISTICGDEAAYAYATKYTSFLQGEIALIRSRHPQEGEDWRRQLEEVMQQVKGFKRSAVRQ